MPIDIALYPTNWRDLSRTIREQAGWACPTCGRPCRKASEPKPDFVSRIREYHPEWLGQLIEEGHIRYKRFELHAAHLNQDPLTDDVTPLCNPCHLRHDRLYYLHNRCNKRERRGQTSLLWPPAMRPEQAGGQGSSKVIQRPLFGHVKWGGHKAPATPLLEARAASREEDSATQLLLTSELRKDNL